MKSKVAAALAALALVLTGCGSATSTATPGASTSAPAEAKLSEWVAKVGLGDSLKALSTSLGALSTDVGAVAPTDPKALADAIAKRGPELLQIAVDIASEPASDDSSYEALRTATAFTIRTFAKLAIGLSSATDADLMAGVNNAIAAISPMNQALQPLSQYISAHGSDVVHPAA